jgi:hypothetical protein
MGSYAATLTLSKPQPNKVSISADIQTFTVHGRPLSLSQMRSGVQALLNDIETRMIKLMKGSPIPFTIPYDIHDNMTDLTRGQSWLSNGPFTDIKDVLLRCYLDDPESKLAYIGPDNKYHYHGIANGDRRRGHHKDNGQTHIILQYTKTTNQKRMDIYLPLLVASRLQKIDDAYLVAV